MLNGKIYIGKHQTKDLNDGYLGSGKLLKSAIEKYGIENFTKEILFQFDNEEAMNAKEAELVTEEFIKEDSNYNLCPGGKGGWGYNNTEEGQKLREFSYRHWQFAGLNKFKELYENDEEFKKQRLQHLNNISKNGLDKIKENNPFGTFYGKTHSEETKQKMRKPKNQGSKNSQFGTMWITNGKENKKIKKDSIIPTDWYKGRVGPP
jgi:dissimilatory sulfite reductase (desulfoviridin) alpha/beta subunit